MCNLITTTSEHHLSFCYPSVLILVLVRVENVQLMWPSSCAGTLPMTQIPAQKLGKPWRGCLSVWKIEQSVLERIDMHCSVAVKMDWRSTRSLNMLLFSTKMLWAGFITCAPFSQQQRERGESKCLMIAGNEVTKLEQQTHDCRHTCSCCHSNSTTATSPKFPLCHAL